MNEEQIGLPVAAVKRRRRGNFARRLWTATGGASAAVFALALPVLIGFGALAIDVGVWSMKSRQAQGAADQAAFSAAVADSAGSDGTPEALAVAADMGFVDGIDDVDIIVSNPPTSGKYAGSNSFWEVTIQQPQGLGLAALFLSDAPNVIARAVAGTGAGGSCFIALSSNADNAIWFQENAQMLNPECGLYSNSSSSSSVRCDNNCEIEGSLYMAGDANIKNNGVVGGNINSDQPPFADPYANVPKTIPPGLPCQPRLTTGGRYMPGRYCSGVDLPNNVNGVQQIIDLDPGVYYIEDRFLLTNNFTIRGTGVTLVFSVPDKNKFNIGNNNTIQLTAPTSGPYAGVAMMSIAGTYTVTFENNTAAKIQGALYFPNQELRMRNNLDSTLCTQLVALTIQLFQNATTENNCPGFGLRGIDAGKIALVE